MAQVILFGKEAQDKLRKGVHTLAKAVGSTLGPYGRNVLIDNNPTPRLTKDGVSVARVITLKDPFENLGALTVKQAAENTYREAGDGTTTATVMAEAAINAAFDVLENTKGLSRAALRRQMNEAVDKVVKVIEQKATPIVVDGKVDFDAVRIVANISSNGDAMVADLVTKAFEYCGADGIVNIAEGQTANSYVQEQSGAAFDLLIPTPDFINAPKSRYVAKNPLVIVCDCALNLAPEIQAIWRVVGDEVVGGRPLVIIANSFSDRVLATLHSNKLSQGLNIGAFISPSFGEQQKALLGDIAAITGATVISERQGYTIEAIKREYVGQCEEINAGFNSANFFGFDAVRVSMRINELEGLKAAMDDEGYAENANAVKSRIKNLLGQAATIYVGGRSKEEVGEIQDRVDDAVCAVQSALEEGVVAGGGVASYTLGWRLFNPSPNTGEWVVKLALMAPYDVIMQNAEVITRVIEEEVSIFAENGQPIFEPVPQTLEPVNLSTAAVIDPAKVLRCALQNAISAAANIITTDTAISIE